MTSPRDPVESRDGDPTAERLLRALNQALERGEPIARHTVLHNAVCERVHALRERGLAPELALIDVKQLVRQSVNVYVARQSAGESADRRNADALLEEIPTWCIEEYFRR
jgi:hypothetical protein